MNLIEQLGGYEQAKHEFEMIKEMKPIYPGEIETNDRLLLEYRRQHNIFEVGDKVVFSSGLNADLFTIKSKPKKKNGVLLLPVILPNGSWFDLMEQFVRHATDEEIKAGKRLEVKSDS